MSDDNDVQIGRQAAFELRLTNQAFEDLEAKTFLAIKTCGPDELEKLRRLVCTVQILDAVKLELHQLVRAGDAAQIALEQEA